jgi:hypothetical protein
MKLRQKRIWPLFLFLGTLLVTVFAPMWGQNTPHSITIPFTDPCTTCTFNGYRATVSGGPYTKIGSVPAGSTAFVDTTGVDGTKYFYVITAQNAAGESAFSNEENAVAIQNPPVPVAAIAVSK